MMLKAWDKLPKNLRKQEIKPYYEILRKKRFSLLIKRLFDILVSLILLIPLTPIYIILAIAIKIDSKGPVFFRQERITKYGKVFRIFKFRSMVTNAEKLGTQVTLDHDPRITRMGRIMRKCRLDETPQILNVLMGDMSFVGTRPEVKKYVDAYTPEMMATLLLPAGITSLASIKYKDEDELLKGAKDVDKCYIEKILPGKMKYNLEAIKHFSLWTELKTMVMTVGAVLGKEY